MDRPKKNCPNQNPKPDRDIAVKKGDRWTDDRSRSGDGGKMMSQQNIGMSRNIVMVVAHGMRRSRLLFVYADRAANIASVKSISEPEEDQSQYQYQEDIHRFTSTPNPTTFVLVGTETARVGSA